MRRADAHVYYTLVSISVVEAHLVANQSASNLPHAPNGPMRQVVADDINSGVRQKFPVL